MMEIEQQRYVAKELAMYEENLDTLNVGLTSKLMKTKSMVRL